MFLINVNCKSPIIHQQPVLSNLSGKNFIFSTFQAELLRQMHDNEDDETQIQDDVYVSLCNKNLGDYTIDQEGVIHRRYNLNSNFDTIEINSPYYENVKDVINEIFYSKIKRGCFKSEFVRQIKPFFRVYDPSKLLIKARTKPEYINWLPDNISEDEFITFQEVESLIQDFYNREEDFITIFESGSQRSENGYPDNWTSYFEVFAFF